MHDENLSLVRLFCWSRSYVTVVFRTSVRNALTILRRLVPAHHYFPDWCGFVYNSQLLKFQIYKKNSKGLIFESEWFIFVQFISDIGRCIWFCYVVRCLQIMMWLTDYINGVYKLPYRPIQIMATLNIDLETPIEFYLTKRLWISCRASLDVLRLQFIWR